MLQKILNQITKYLLECKNHKVLKIVTNVSQNSSLQIQSWLAWTLNKYSTVSQPQLVLTLINTKTLIQSKQLQNETRTRTGQWIIIIAHFKTRSYLLARQDVGVLCF